MVVNQQDLSTPEKGLDLTTRETAPRGADKVAEDLKRAKKGEPGADAEIEAIRGRVKAAKTPPSAVPANLSCAHCFRSGWEAAVKAIEG